MMAAPRLGPHRPVAYGSITTYGALAAQLNAGLDARQIGAAVGRNPLCILIPCHRVISSTGKLTGCAGGLRRKQHLLDLERANTAPHQPSLSGGPTCAPSTERPRRQGSLSPRPASLMSTARDRARRRDQAARTGPNFLPAATIEAQAAAELAS